MLPRPRPSRLSLPAALLAPLVFLASAHTASAEPAPLHQASIRGGCALVDVDSIHFDHGRKGWHLVVAGLKHHANMNVGLEHRLSPGGLWTVEVVGCTGGILGIPIRTPYWVDLPLRDLGRVKSLRIVAANGVWRPRLPAGH